MAALRDPDPRSVAFIVGALFVVALLVAAAGWLLVGQTHVEAEQHVFVVGSLLVLGGAAAYLGMSALLAGLVVGTAWNVAGDIAKTRITRDLYYFQHPLVVLVLIVAGAHATLSIDAFALAAVIIAVRAIARKTGSWLAARFPADTGPRESLIAAGLIGIGIAIDIYRVAPGSELTGTIVGTVVIATIGSNMVSAFLPSPGPRRPSSAWIWPAYRRPMKRLAGIVLIAAAMVIVREVGPAGDAETRATALALGFALVAALVTGEFLRRSRLPRLTGYLLFGLLIGPYLANVITEPMARQLLVVNGVATTLIAFIAGLTLNFERLERRVAGAGSRPW